MITVNRLDLAKACERLSRVCPQKSPSPMLSQGLFEFDDALSYRGTDTRLEVSGTLEAKGKGAFAVSPKALGGALSSLTGETATIKPGAGFIQVTGDTKRTFKLGTLEAEHFPHAFDVGGAPVEVQTDVLAELVATVSHATLETEDRAHFRRVRVLKDHGKLHSFAADGHRLATRTVDCDVPLDLDIQPAMARMLAAIETPTVLVASDNRGMSVQFGHEKLSAIGQSGEFPDLSHYLEGIKPAHFVEVPVARLLETVKAIQRVDAERVTILSFSTEGKLTVECSSADAAKDDIECEVPADFELRINGSYLVNALSVITGDVKVCYGGPELVLEQHGWRAIIMHMDKKP